MSLHVIVNLIAFFIVFTFIHHHPNRYSTSTLYWFAKLLLKRFLMYIFASLVLTLYLVDYFYGGPHVFWPAYGVDSLPNSTLMDGVSNQGHVLLLILLTENSYCKCCDFLLILLEDSVFRWMYVNVCGRTAAAASVWIVSYFYLRKGETFRRKTQQAGQLLEEGDSWTLPLILQTEPKTRR